MHLRKEELILSSTLFCAASGSDNFLDGKFADRYTDHKANSVPDLRSKKYWNRRNTHTGGKGAVSMNRDRVEVYLAEYSLPKYETVRGSKRTADALNRGIERMIKRRPTETTHFEMQFKESDEFPDAYQDMKNVLMECGKVLEEEAFYRNITGIVYAGAAGMNTAVLVIHVEQTSMTITAFAKEGLIKQHTGEKAIEIVSTAFSRRRFGTA